MLLKQIYGGSRPDIAFPKVRALIEFHIWYSVQRTRRFARYDRSGRKNNVVWTSSAKLGT